MRISGPSFKYRSQRYWRDGAVDHQTRDGRTIKLQRLYTLCPACGVGFHIQATASAIKTRNLRRRCDGCKHQGVPVEYRLPPKTGGKRPGAASKGDSRPGRRPVAASSQGVPANRQRLLNGPLSTPGAESAEPRSVSALAAALKRAAARAVALQAALGMLEPSPVPCLAPAALKPTSAPAADGLRCTQG